MEYTGENGYRVVQKQELNSETLTSLAVLYCPVIGQKAFALYHLLSAEANKADTVLKLSRLCHLLDMDINALSDSIRVLEQFKLLRSYYSQKMNSFRFVLQNPLSPAKFLNHEVFSRLYAKKVGSQETEMTGTLHIAEPVNEESEQEVTSEFDFSYFNDKWNLDDEIEYGSLLKKRYAGVVSEFDMAELLRITSYNLMPEYLRTAENLEIIGQLATVLSISPETMRQFLATAIDYNDKDELVFDPEKLRMMCLKTKKVSEEVTAGGYQMQPVQFLTNLQNGLPVSFVDKKSLEYLQTDLKLPREVINYLVEYVYTRNNHTIGRNYLEKIATTWASRGVDTLEKAREQTKEKAPRKRSKVPDFVNINNQPQQAQDYDKIMEELFGQEDR